jgi:hypothetical protein
MGADEDGGMGEDDDGGMDEDMEGIDDIEPSDPPPQASSPTAIISTTAMFRYLTGCSPQSPVLLLGEPGIGVLRYGKTVK